VSTAGIVLGVAGATASRATIVTRASPAWLPAAMSMAVGEHVSVSSQRDTEAGGCSQGRAVSCARPPRRARELTDLYAAKGLPRELAAEGGRAADAQDALAAHAEVELGINPAT
jgi:VIT1/CCC1 family predicted Fe2+/Mn2+ transporter